MFDTAKLLTDVFDPQPGERAVVMVDLPTSAVPDNPQWQQRRAMAAEWRGVLEQLGRQRGFEVLPLLTFPATGGNNADLPARGTLDGQNVELLTTLLSATLVIALTEFSATAPLAHLADRKQDFRAASMPGVARSMEQTALAADYTEVARRCRLIFDRMQGAELCDVTFSTGHRCWFDLRFRTPEMDDGFLPRFKPGDRIINLPSGETFVVPYEGERQGVPSWTAGTIPVSEEGETALFRIHANRVVEVEGSGPVAGRYRALFAEDPARANIAELAFGVNDKARVSGIVLEDEKAGFHWAFGRSDHLGGVTGVDCFRSASTVVHQDIVYARGNPIRVERATLRTPGRADEDIIVGGEYRFQPG